MTFSTTAFSSARRWLAVAAVFALSLPSPAAASGFYAPSSTLRLPDAVLDAAHDVAYPSGTAPLRLSDYHHARRDDAEKFVVVVATYFTGCTPGRADYPSFTKYVTALRTRVDAGDLPGNVKFVVSLKNGVNEGVAKAWAEIDGADDVSDSLVIVDDRHRSLVYQLFDAAVHPAYAVIDHCGRYRALLPSIAETLNATTNADANAGAEENGGLGNDLVSVVEALLRETETNPACPGDDAVAPLVAPAGVRVKQEESAHVPGAVPSTDACVPGFGITRSVARVGAPAGSNFLAPFASPRALAFHPTSGDLWVANQDTDALTVLRGISAYANADSAVGKNPRVEASTHRLDRARYHYMDKMAALAFGSDAAGAPLVTCQESENDYDGSKAPNRFMGPSLYDTVKVEGTVKTGGWPRGAEIYVDQAGAACDPESDASSDATCFMTHTDMLHATPLCAGIAHDPEPATPFANVFWVNDGLNETLVRYDFEQPHGPGSLDHSLANVRRFPEIALKRVPGVPGHVVVDAATRTVFVADVGGGRVVAVHADSGVFTGDARNDLGGNFTLWSSPEPSFEYSLFGCASHYAFVSNLDRPSGLALRDNVLYVGEHGTGKILAFHKTTGVKLGEVQTGASRLFGLAVQPETGDVFFADGDDADAVGFVNVTAPCGADASAAIPSGPAMAWPSSSESDTGVRYCVDTSAESPFADALNVAVHTISHDDGYLNMTPLGPGYGASQACLACSNECDNDMLLMSGFLCHKCLPDNCRGGVFDAGVSKGTCVNLIGRGYECACDQGYHGDHCQFRSRAETRFSHRTLATAIAAAAAVVSLR